MRTTPFVTLGCLLWASAAVLANPCKPSKPSSSSVVPSASPSPSLCPDLILKPNFPSDWGIDWYVLPGGNGPTYNYGVMSECGTDADAPATCFYIYTTASSQNNPTTLTQDGIPVTPGATYLLTFRFRVASDSGVDGMTVSLNGVVVQDVSFLVESQLIDNSWHDVSVSWTAPTIGSTDYPDTSVASLAIAVPDTLAQAITLQMIDFFMNTCAEGSYV
ncbi:hypothetical protein SEUCBS139899_001007 [Sporothrix eucalyptigena]|uniref:CBM-cenC domain-containing protein n=1 Tax=Sporothrix eucalyptigena TaxID=1812306 RepID=A0ABP0C7L6_9PEZI